jgi:hypothetical protein
MHGSFITGAYCLANSVGCQDTSAITPGQKELFLVFEWSEVFELVVGHVIRCGNGQVSKPFLCHMIKPAQGLRGEIVLITN